MPVPQGTCSEDESLPVEWTNQSNSPLGAPWSGVLVCRGIETKARARAAGFPLALEEACRLDRAEGRLLVREAACLLGRVVGCQRDRVVACRQGLVADYPPVLAAVCRLGPGVAFPLDRAEVSRPVPAVGCRQGPPLT